MRVQRLALKNNGVKTAEKICNDDSVLADVLGAIKEIQYGSVQVHIQDGKIVQIDKMSKARIR